LLLTHFTRSRLAGRLIVKVCEVTVRAKTKKSRRRKFDKPTVLMVSTYPPDTDGIASYTARLKNALQKQSILIRIAANGSDWKRNSPFYIYNIMQKAMKSKTDIVHVQLSYFTFGNEYYTGFFPLLVISLKLWGKKVVVTLHDVVPKSNLTRDFLKRYTSPRFLIFKRLAFIGWTNITCSIADRVIVHSDVAKKVLIRDYGIPQRKIHVIPHGIDQASSSLIKNCLKTNSLKDEDDPIISYFGLVRHGKGLEDLIKSWQIVSKRVNAQLWIIGGKHPHLQDNCYEECLNLVRKLGLESSVRFFGYVPSEELPAYFIMTDVFVFPYKEWGDVIASSGALSVVAPYLKPIIATDVPAFADLKSKRAALIVKRGDINGLASAIIKVLTDAQVSDSLIDNLGKWLLELSWSNVAKKTAALYRRLLLNKGNRNLGYTSRNA